MAKALSYYSALPIKSQVTRDSYEKGQFFEKKNAFKIPPDAFAKRNPALIKIR